jgi:hypothetical protein
LTQLSNKPSIQVITAACHVEPWQPVAGA